MTSNSKTLTGAALQKLIKDSGHNQGSFASAVGTSRVYTNTVIAGHNVPSSGWLNMVATGLGLTEEQSVELHRAAARDHGFKIDLS